MKIRLQKFLSQCGVASRRKAEELIVDGKIRVNGRIVSELGMRIDPDSDTVKVGRKVVRPEPKGLLLFHKPREVVSTMRDPEGRRCIADYLSARYRSYFPVGRLDYHTSGLLVLTNDGDLAERLMHPRNGFKRVYEARVKGVPAYKDLEKIAAGIRLKDGIAKAQIEVLKQKDNNAWLLIVVREGRNRLVRRLMDKIGCPVLKLRRTAFGPCKLGNLKSGQITVASEREYGMYKSLIEG